MAPPGNIPEQGQSHARDAPSNPAGETSLVPQQPRSHPSTSQPSTRPRPENTEGPSSPVVVVLPTAEQKETARQLLQGLDSLVRPLALRVVALVGANYTDMAPMERFVAETLGWPVTADGGSNDNMDMGGGDHDVGEAPGCWSCRATVGSSSP